MTRRKKKRVGGSYTQKPNDLRDELQKGYKPPLRVRQLSAEELELRRQERDARHAARLELRSPVRRAS